MSEGTIQLIQPHRGTVVYARKVNRGNYESEDASISVQFDVDPADEVGTSGRAEAAFNQAKALVLDQLGLSDRPAANPVAAVQGAFPGAQEVAPAATPTPAPTATPPTATASASSGDEVKCPNCNGPMYDNRATKKNPRQPDYRCKNYRAQPPCEGVIWPPR